METEDENRFYVAIGLGVAWVFIMALKGLQRLRGLV